MAKNDNFIGEKGEIMENVGLIIALLGSAFTIIAAMIAMMLWVRSEANADRRDIINLIIAIKEDVQAIQLEMKDFHTRLCEIEQRRK